MNIFLEIIASMFDEAINYRIAKARVEAKYAKEAEKATEEKTPTDKQS